MSELNASNLRKEHGNEGPDLVGVTELTSPYFMVPPSGTTSERPENPQKGTLRFNTDIGSLEYFKGDTIGWQSINRNPNQRLQGGNRGVFMGGYTTGLVNTIQYITISTLGNAVDFGDRTVTGSGATFSSITRGVSGGKHAPSYVDTVDYITIASTGNAIDFGNMTINRARGAGISNQIRGIIGGGYDAPAQKNEIDYCTIAATGNFVDFGDLATAVEGPGGCASTTRGIFVGGNSDGTGSGGINVISYVTIATTGNPTDFGDSLVASDMQACMSNATRGLIGGGYVSPATLNTISYITISTLGNSIDFGDMSVTKYIRGSITDPTRGVWAGGAGGGASDVIDYVTIATQGNATDFGNLTAAMSTYGGASTGHGGL